MLCAIQLDWLSQNRKPCTGKTGCDPIETWSCLQVLRFHATSATPTLPKKAFWTCMQTVRGSPWHSLALQAPSGLTTARHSLVPCSISCLLRFHPRASHNVVSVGPVQRVGKSECSSLHRRPMRSVCSAGAHGQVEWCSEVLRESRRLAQSWFYLSRSDTSAARVCMLEGELEGQTYRPRVSEASSRGSRQNARRGGDVRACCSHVGVKMHWEATFFDKPFSEHVFCLFLNIHCLYFTGGRGWLAGERGPLHVKGT